MDNLERQRKQKKFDEVKHTLRKFEGLLEIGILTVIYYLFWRNCYDIPDMPTFYYKGKYLLSAIYAFLTFVLFFYGDSFKFGHIKLGDAVISQWIAVVISNFMTYFQLCLIANKMINCLPMLALTGVDIAVTFVLCYIFTAIYHNFCIPRKMVMVYGSKNAVSLKFKMNTRGDKYRIEKLLNCNELSYEQIISQISEYDAVVINDVEAQMRNDILKYCYQNSIRTYLVPKISDIIYSGGDDITLFDTPLKLIKGRGLTPAQRFLKRAFDLVLSGIATIPALLIIGIVAIAIKIEDGGSVFYKQKRLGHNGEFEVLKLRSMKENAEALGVPQLATENDPRITKVGKFIRACRLDELPQVLNILKGDMSIVGPRPERLMFYEEFEKTIPEFRLRTKVKAGLTGYAQIYGKYNTTPLDKLRMDLMYIENYSFLTDVRLVLKTVQILFKKESTEGVAEENSVLKKDNDSVESKNEKNFIHE